MYKLTRRLSIVLRSDLVRIKISELRTISSRVAWRLEQFKWLCLLTDLFFYCLCCWFAEFYIFLLVIHHVRNFWRHYLIEFRLDKDLCCSEICLLPRMEFSPYFSYSTQIGVHDYLYKEAEYTTPRIAHMGLKQ